MGVDYFSPSCAHAFRSDCCILCVARCTTCFFVYCVIVGPGLSCVTRFRWRKSSCIPQDFLTAPLGLCQILQCVKCPSNEECGPFSDSDIVDLTMPLPPLKKRLPASEKNVKERNALFSAELLHCFLLKRRQRSDCDVYLTKGSCKHCTQPLLQVIRA